MTRGGLAAVASLLVVAACTAVGPRPPGPSTPAEPTPARTAVPTPVPVPETPPDPPVPSTAPALGVSAPQVRILLERTTDGLELGDPGRPWWVEVEGTGRWLWGPVQLALEDPGWWQVAAVADPARAEAAAAQLRSALGEPATVLVRPNHDGLHRIRVRWPSGGPADPRPRLAEAGFEGAYPVREAVRVAIVPDHGTPLTVTSAVLVPHGERPMAVGEGRYRGRLRVRVAGGEMLLVNDLPLEAYLRGVVPLEMGPGQFPELEALKAQAVAARTYAVAHLGDHEDEGYDLCDTAACQVYGGAGPEHPLTDRAIRDTAGLVATFAGEPVDAMFTSTCGGHTDRVEALFPGRGRPYLEGVECAWERELALVGLGDGPWRSLAEAEAEIARRALGLEPGAAPPAVLAAVAARCGGRTGAAASAPRTAGPAAFAAELLAAAGLDSAGEHLVSADEAVGRVLELADLFEIGLTPPGPDWAGSWHLRAALAVLRLQGVVTVDSGELVPHPAGVALYPRRADRSEPLVMPLPLAERVADAVRPVARAAAWPGTTAERWRLGDTALAVFVVRSGGHAEADRRSAWRQWARERTWAELGERLGMPDLERVLVTARTATGRVVGLAAEGASGRRSEWRGFEVRRVLGLPETLFTLHAMVRPDGTKVVRFLGRGWGHGVGLCQNGAYGLARAGMGFAQILAHYYPGTVLSVVDD